MRRAAAATIGATMLLAGSAAAQAPLAAQACLGCHGQGGTGAGGVPAIAARPAAELVAQMHGFRDNQRPGTIMGRIARGYTEAEIAAVAAWFERAR